MVLKTKNGEAMTEIEDKEGCQHNKEVVSKQREIRFHLNIRETFTEAKSFSSWTLLHQEVTMARVRIVTVCLYIRVM